MAKLHTYFVLCPLIDQNSFLGVSNDIEEENVIVTLGRNVVNKYRLSDQKQIGGWTSKDHITAAVIYDKEQEKYIGIFNDKVIKMWQGDTENLDKLKKHKFSCPILKLIPRKNQTSLLVFTNGNCVSLSYGLENRKTIEGKSMLKNEDKIVNVECYTQNNTDYICYITRNTQDKYEIVNCPLRNELGDLEKAKVTKEKIERPEDNVYVVGNLITASEVPFVYILWSDSKINAYDLTSKRWKNIGTVPWISTLSSVSIAWMGEKHLILFGCNLEQDGAIIVAYNTSIGVGSCRYPMKMYTEDAKLCCINNRIILESSNHIGMLPYIVETSRSLSSLLGSHEVIQDDFTEVAGWGVSKPPAYSVTDEIKELLPLGLTERAMCLQVIPPLLYKTDYQHVMTIVKQFKDIPESVLVLLLKYCINTLKADSVDVSKSDEFKKFYKSKKKTEEESQEHIKKLNFLNLIFEIPYSDSLLIPHLRNGFTLNDALFLMSYICQVIVDSDFSSGIDYESKLFDWCTLLMDAFYQQYLMTKDEKVTIVLENMRNLVVDLTNQLMEIDRVLPIMNKIIRGKNIQENEDTLPYAIEIMQI